MLHIGILTLLIGETWLPAAGASSLSRRHNFTFISRHNCPKSKKWNIEARRENRIIIGKCAELKLTFHLKLHLVWVYWVNRPQHCRSALGKAVVHSSSRKVFRCGKFSKPNRPRRKQEIGVKHVHFARDNGTPCTLALALPSIWRTSPYIGEGIARQVWESTEKSIARKLIGETALHHCSSLNKLSPGGSKIGSLSIMFL